MRFPQDIEIPIEEPEGCLRCSDFYIGMEFWSACWRYVCCDVGKRTAVAMPLERREKLPKSVDFSRRLDLLDAYDVGGCERTYREAIASYGKELRDSVSSYRVQSRGKHPFSRPAATPVKIKQLVAGRVFYTEKNVWRCTDVGTFGIMAIIVDDLSPQWERFSPYTVAEYYFGSNIRYYCALSASDAVAQWGATVKRAISKARR